MIRARSTEQAMGCSLTGVCQMQGSRAGDLPPDPEMHVGQEMAIVKGCKVNGLRNGAVPCRPGIERGTVTETIRRASRGLTGRGHYPEGARCFRVLFTAAARAPAGSAFRRRETLEKMPIAGRPGKGRRTSLRPFGGVRSDLDPSVKAA